MIRFKIPDDFDSRITAAFQHFWTTRVRQTAEQEKRGASDQGSRSAVTGGKQLDGFAELIHDVLLLNGIHESDIFINTDVELPGYYRPNKKWDLLVVHDGNIMAVEFKSQVGPSFGNNFNNRTEEAMGSALDLWTAYREGVFGTCQSPWLGYFLVLEDCAKSNEPVRVRSRHFPVLQEFADASYAKRYEIFCRKLLLERQYNATCLALTHLQDAVAEYRFPGEDLSLRRFIASMLGRAAASFAEHKRQK